MESVRIKTLKKWSFFNELDVVSQDGSVTQAKCKSCSMIDQETLLAEGERLGLKGSVLSSADSHRVEVTCIHRANFQRRVG